MEIIGEESTRWRRQFLLLVFAFSDVGMVVSAGSPTTMELLKTKKKKKLEMGFSFLVGWSVRFALLNVSDPIALGDFSGAPSLEFEKGIDSVDNHRDESKKLFFKAN